MGHCRYSSATYLHRTYSKILRLATANTLDPGVQIAGRKEVDYAIGPNLSEAGGREAEVHKDKLPWVMRIGA